MNIEIKHLKSAFNKAVTWNLIKESPFKSIKLLKIKGNNLPQYLTKDQIDELLNSIKDENFKFLIRFYLNTACRRNEAINLIWKDVDLRKKTLVFRATKSGEDRIVPINKNTYNILTELKSNNGSVEDTNIFEHKPGYVTQKLKSYLRNAKIDVNKSVHVLRHSAISHMIMNGVDLATIREIAGHSDISITMMYVHLSPDHKRKAIEKLNF